jgi:hypothetical protein
MGSNNGAEWKRLKEVSMARMREYVIRNTVWIHAREMGLG